MRLNLCLRQGRISIFLPQTGVDEYDELSCFLEIKCTSVPYAFDRGEIKPRCNSAVRNGQMKVIQVIIQNKIVSSKMNLESVGHNSVKFSS